MTCPILPAAFSLSHIHTHRHLSFTPTHLVPLCVCAPLDKKKKEEEKRTTSEIPKLLLHKVLISLQELSVLVRRVLVIRQNVLGEFFAVPPTLSTVIAFFYKCALSYMYYYHNITCNISCPRKKHNCLGQTASLY